MKMEQMKLTFVNVGYGEAILLEIPEASRRDGIFTALIDGGSADRQEYEDRSSGRIPVWDYLQKEHIGHLDLMVCTHIHEDHDAESGSDTASRRTLADAAGLLL